MHSFHEASSPREGGSLIKLGLNESYYTPGSCYWSLCPVSHPALYTPHRKP